MKEDFHMRLKSSALVPVLLMVVAGMISWRQAIAQAPTLQEQLAAQYKLVKMASDSSGYSVVEEGTLLSVQKGGVVGVPYKNVTTRTATFQDGTVHAAADPTHNSTAQKMGKLFCGLHKCPTTPDVAKDENATKFFKVGDKVYAEKIDVNVAKDTVTMSIVACDTCNKTDPPTYNKANVVFQFANGTLAKAGAGEVEDIIGQLLSISDEAQAEGGQQQGGDQGQQQAGQQGGQDQGQAQGQGQPAAQQQAEPQTIQLGMTTDQVTAALGKPDKDVKLGAKEIYIYKDMKVTFKDGKVADVQ
jgi:hypothetical protein